MTKTLFVKQFSCWLGAITVVRDTLRKIVERFASTMQPLTSKYDRIDVGVSTERSSQFLIRDLPRPGKARGRELVVLLSVGVLGIGWAAHHSILRNAASFWVISDQVSQADAIVVLGGRVDIRPAAAAELIHLS
jgi:hypothetical protein